MDVPKGFYERTSKYLRDMKIDVSNKVVLVGGVGTLGSRIVRDLARFNFKKIIVVDIDFVGPENVGYQCYHSEEIGQKKVEAIAKRFSKYHPWTAVEPHFLEVYTLSGLVTLNELKKYDELVASSDAIVSTFDSAGARATSLLLAFRRGKVFVDAGLGVTRGYVKLLKEGYCPICERVWEDQVRYYTNPNLAEVVAAFASQAVLYALSGKAWPAEVTVNLDAPFNPVSVSEIRNEGCPLCSEEAKRISLEEIPKFLMEKIY